MRTWLLFIAAVIVGVFAGIGAALPTFESVAGANAPSKATEALVNDATAPALVPVDQPQPIVEVPEEEFNFGAADVETKGSHAFVFRNVGQGDLILGKGKTTCKCTISSLDGKPIPPGGSAEVKLEWTVKASQMMADEFRQEAVIFTNDRKRDYVRLVVFGKISRTIVAIPPQIDFGTLLRTADETRTAHVYSQLAGPFEIPSWSFSNEGLAEFFDVKMRQLAPEEFTFPDAKSGYELTVRAKPGLPLGMLEQTIRLQTNLPGAPEFVLPVEGFVDSDFRIIGGGWNKLTQSIDLGSFVQGEGKTQKLSIRVEGPHWHEIELSAPQVDIPGLKVTLGAREDKQQGALYPLTIEVPDNLPAMAYLGKPQNPYGRIKIATTHPEIPTLEIRVKLVVRD